MYPPCHLIDSRRLSTQFRNCQHWHTGKYSCRYVYIGQNGPGTVLFSTCQPHSTVTITRSTSTVYRKLLTRTLERVTVNSTAICAKPLKRLEIDHDKRQQKKDRDIHRRIYPLERCRVPHIGSRQRLH